MPPERSRDVRGPGRSRPRRRAPPAPDPASPRGTPGASWGRGSTRSTRWPTTSAAPTARSATTARSEPVERPSSSRAASAPTGQSSSTIRRQRGDEVVPGAAEHLLEHGGEEADAEDDEQTAERRALGQHQQQVGGDRGRRAHRQRAGEPLDAGDQHPREHQPELQHQHGGQPAAVAEQLGQADEQGDRDDGEQRRRAGGGPAAQRGVPAPAPRGLTGRSWQKPSVRSARRAER